ncbi:hypothetical protein EDI_253090 [Entamoeba dispar SAW760]|uniref:Uncharacterized protein n=1 Tax=Entamoeba dispar (strain ATCC PRA-260 / SAW760) TaxID=370354 RepID=B0EFB4_ENTDS|nr:uncharacterized protein EDI_253090 [Entamoeba dispar SAW760]EDR26844.1 hypothetical protein EDI_253090 [Entamoeba dispar SAW760]|eukprot:EDR26844.1 hypothetical protein EDI_253090 [Entamoeba dispar SAW760]
MNTAITISFSIHYKTNFGEELFLNLDDSTCRKLTWMPGHIWMGTVTVVRPRSIRWWYSVVKDDSVIRIEDMTYPRTYRLDKLHKYFHVFDRWENPISSVSPLTLLEKPTPLISDDQLNRIRSKISVKPKKSPYITSFLVRIPSSIRSCADC